MRHLFSFIASAKLTHKLAMFVAVMVVFVAAVVGTVALYQGTQSSLEAADDKLATIVSARRAALKSYLESIEQDLRSLAASPATREAITEFETAWHQLGGNQTERLQRLYIRDNPHPIGKKEELDAASDGSEYSRVHARFHPYFRKLLRERAYYDIFLFDAEGNLVYTVFKELDYATNLNSGNWKDTDLGKVFRAAADAGKADSISFFDFRPYAPSNDAPASFISTPVVGADGSLIGVLVFQMPIGRINEVMSVTTGLGETGESIIVGRDKLMRSDSRFSKTSTILKQAVKTPASEAAIAGKTGLTHGEGYRGVEVYGAFAPLDFHGVRWAIISEQTRDEFQAPLVRLRNLVIALSALAALIGAAIGLFFARRIARPIVVMTGAMSELADGNTDIDVPGAGRGDEIGQMAKTVLVFKENALERARLRSESQKEQETRAKRSAKMDELITNFDGAVRVVMGAVTSATDTVNLTAQEMSATAEETNAQAAAVAAAAEEASSSSATVAGSTEELTSTIDEISQKVMKSSEIAESATVQADGTNAQVAELAEAANKIGSVVELISAIAEQTNLLALNATIEAARAGEAGKGFAVVASEVKELAGQTAKATTEIGNHIEAVQTITGQSVTAIKGISETIEEINSMSASVASAITQQQAATQEIARAVQQAASGTNEVSTNITGVSEASGTTSAAANKLTEAAAELSSQSGSLRHEVETFLAEVRAA